MKLRFRRLLRFLLSLCLLTTSSLGEHEAVSRRTLLLLRRRTRPPISAVWWNSRRKGRVSSRLCPTLSVAARRVSKSGSRLLPTTGFARGRGFVGRQGKGSCAEVRGDGETVLAETRLLRRPLIPGTPRLPFGLLLGSFFSQRIFARQRPPSRRRLLGGFGAVLLRQGSSAASVHGPQTATAAASSHVQTLLRDERPQTRESGQDSRCRESRGRRLLQVSEAKSAEKERGS